MNRVLGSCRYLANARPYSASLTAAAARHLISTTIHRCLLGLQTAGCGHGEKTARVHIRQRFLSDIEAIWQTHRSGVKAPTMMGTSLMGCDLLQAAFTFKTLVSSLSWMLNIHWQSGNRHSSPGWLHLKTCAMKGMCSSKLCSACGNRAPARQSSPCIMQHVSSSAVYMQRTPRRPRLHTSSALRLMV